jgi:nitroreductase
LTDTALPGGSRPVQTAITARRSIRKFRADPIPQDVVQRVLVAAVQAPNHRRTQPWRFFVVDRQGRVRASLAELAREVAAGRANQPLDSAAHARVQAKVDEIIGTPVLLFVYSVPGRDSVETRENYAAVCCAVQNILLAATEEGLAAGWSTGGVCAQPDRLATLLGGDPAWTLVALLYVGIQDEDHVQPVIRRIGPESFTHWLA